MDIYSQIPHKNLVAVIKGAYLHEDRFTEFLSIYYFNCHFFICYTVNTQFHQT